MKINTEFDLERLEEEEEVLLLEPRAEFDPCIVGIVERFNSRFVLYSKRKVLEVHQRNGMAYEDVIEHYGFNMNGGWYGDATWGFLDDEVVT